jgi:hypothetical protein
MIRYIRNPNASELMHLEVRHNLVVGNQFIDDLYEYVICITSDCYYLDEEEHSILYTP